MLVFSSNCIKERYIEMAYKNRLSELFTLLDINNTSFVAQKDVDAVSKNIASVLGQAVGSSTMQGFDTFFTALIQNFGKDGKLTKDQLIQGVESTLVGKDVDNAPAWWSASVNSLFNAYNINNKQILTVADVSQVVLKFKPSATPASIQRAYDWVLDNGKGIPKPPAPFDSGTFPKIVFQWETSAVQTPEADLLLPFFYRYEGIVPLAGPTKSSG